RHPPRGPFRRAAHHSPPVAHGHGPADRGPIVRGPAQGHSGLPAWIAGGVAARARGGGGDDLLADPPAPAAASAGPRRLNSSPATGEGTPGGAEPVAWAQPT